MTEATQIEEILNNHGYADFKWMSGKDVLVRQWVRFKCTYGCESYGMKGGCPPSAPSIEECREFFAEYERILVMHLKVKLDHPDDRRGWSRDQNMKLLKLERDIFLAGHHKAFLLFMDECRICEVCGGTRLHCENPHLSRPCPEGLGVDVFGTVRPLGFPIHVLRDFDQEMNRYAFLLVD